MGKIPSLYVARAWATREFCGKTAIILGLALKYKEEGYRVGYFKPVGWDTIRRLKGAKIDEDAQLMQKVLTLKSSLNMISPVIFGTRYLKEIATTDPNNFRKRIFEAYKNISKNKDFVIIEGPHFQALGASASIDSMELSKKLESHLLLISTGEEETSIDNIICKKRWAISNNVNFAGAILNFVPKRSLERIKGFALPILEKNGVDVFGVIPDNIELRAPTVREICERIECNLLTGENEMENLIEDFLVGAMTPEAALSYFRRSLRKAVITGGDRVDIQLAALETDTSALILTGNIYPDIRVLARAEALKVPVLLVPFDTYTTVRNIATLTGRITHNDVKKIELAKKLVEDFVDWRKILDQMQVR